MSHYYSTQPFFAWCLNRHFYGGRHYVHVAPFYPYRKANPKSSNPLEIYKDLYHPWLDRDDFDKFILQTRVNLRKGILAHKKDRRISSDLADHLERLCDKVDIRFFCPVVYRVDTDNISATRLQRAGSALLLDSDEYLITDLRDEEFELLFYDKTKVDEALNKLFELPDRNEDKALQILSDYAVSTSP